MPLNVVLSASRSPKVLSTYSNGKSFTCLNCSDVNYWMSCFPNTRWKTAFCCLETVPDQHSSPTWRKQKVQLCVYVCVFHVLNDGFILYRVAATWLYIRSFKLCTNIYDFYCIFLISPLKKRVLGIKQPKRGRCLELRWKLWILPIWPLSHLHYQPLGHLYDLDGNHRTV